MIRTTDSRYARYVGRVGALAFALGVGVAVGSNTAVAAADTGSSTAASAHSARHAAKAPANRTAAKSTGTVQVTARPAASATPVRPAPPTRAATVTDALAYARREVERVQATQNAQNVSVLATPDQLAGERTATRLANSLAVRLSKAVLKVGWRAAAHKNFAAVGGPDQKNLDQLDQAVDEYATQAAMEVQLLDSNNPRIFQQVAPTHSWYGQNFAGSRIWYDNPDTIYRFVGVNTVSSYVITGKFSGDMPADTNFSVLTGLDGTTADNINGKDLVLNADKTFSITVDSTPTAPGQTNHLYLPPGSTLITTRNTLSDWTTQDPMSLSIQRLSGPRDSLFSQFGGFAFPGIGTLVSKRPLLTRLVSFIPPLPAPRLLQSVETAAIMLFLGIKGENQYMGVATNDSTGKQKAPNVLSSPDHNAAFLATQLQSVGYFQLADDEALIITINPGKARFLSVPVTNDWTITDNYWDEQTSLNIAQSVKNSDGTYTIVVSPTDPDVANWVSTGGLNQGTISIRFQDFNPASDVDPTVSSQVVKLNQLSGLPTVTATELNQLSGLPTVTATGLNQLSGLPMVTATGLNQLSGLPTVTPEERQAQIAQRQLGYNKRYAPYPQA